MYHRYISRIYTQKKWFYSHENNRSEYMNVFFFCIFCILSYIDEQEFTIEKKKIISLSHIMI